jgi:hypothetical protein
MTLLAGDNLIIEDSVRIENGILYCRKLISLSDQAQIRGQLFAGQRFLAVGESSLQYPSALVVKSDQDRQGREPEIAFLEQSHFDGLILLYNPALGNKAISPRSSIPGRVRIRSTIPSMGGIYSSGATEVTGVFNGFISTEITEQHRNRTHWTNALGNLALSRMNILSHYPLPVCFNQPGALRILGMRQEG